ncbi:helix-turn-helix transcriptional regulator [Photobacterium sp. SDRW27]|uniref:AraC family transcriptional regulator n=1 Tax=Photobacterium obscurum TaxID=2829490 RepID=UPI002243804A|nr:helix-turn-helix transcriptional regulator [Photobacterium obscurum]MCW8329099.1 helix-turn-helix transcriptional regulator [Photobacterium obscurum]
MEIFDPDKSKSAIDILQLRSSNTELQAPIHSHDKGQLVMPVTGSMMCKVDDEIWMVPSESAVWIPAGVPHTNTPAASATFCFVFLDSTKVELPDRCCTLSISPLVREIVLYLSTLSAEELAEDHPTKLVEVLFDLMAKLPREQLNFPLSNDPRLRKVADTLLSNPADRRTIKEWASFLAMSERTFSRLVARETGMTFGLWRKQLHIVVSLQLLTSGFSVQEASEQLGYESVSAFITMFKKALGKSPKRYIQKSSAG